MSRNGGCGVKHPAQVPARQANTAEESWAASNHLGDLDSVLPAVPSAVPTLAESIAANEDPVPFEGAQLPFFVYGTLRENYGCSSALPPDSRRISGASVGGARMYADRIPYVVPTADEHSSVVGELVEVPPVYWAEALRRCDVLEGFNDGTGYLRRRVAVRLDEPDGGAKTVNAWIYIANPRLVYTSRFTEVPSGDFMDYRKPERPVRRG
ncbi:MAG: gamma-glutamylcyclotransferase family protein [Acidimicrobiales bacterium]